MTAEGASRLTLDELEAKIREGAARQEPVDTTLDTSKRIIARVTDGIYREPWAAFRELVVNAYDADASYVVIETGQPDFHRMTVRDDGIGMSPRTLAYIVQNIGGSSKRTSSGAELRTVRSGAHDLSPGGRQLIGKIGIGLFAVAQLTQHFQIITKAAGELYRLSATVKLRTHDEQQMQEDEADYVAGNVRIVSEKVPDSEQDSQGTSVVLYQLRPEVRRVLHSRALWEASSVETGKGEAVQKPPQFHIGHSLGKGEHKPSLPWQDADSPERKFTKFVEATASATGRSTKAANLDHLDEYLRLMWKLSLSLPLEYIGCHPLDIGGLDGIRILEYREPGQAVQVDLDPQESLGNHLGFANGTENTGQPFNVVLDGIALSRPIRLARRLETDSRVGTPVMLVARQSNPFNKEDLERAGGRLSFTAYLYWNSRIVPKETAGVLIRIGNASGTLFDSTFLNYRISEQTRLRQITAEVFVHEGLDSAINIDRESFNYSHPHFLFVQKWLHRALRLLTNRLKAFAAADLAASKEELRSKALAYASEIWHRRLGEDADPPFVDPTVRSLPKAVGTTDIEWSGLTLRTGKGKAAGIARVSALAAVLEAYGVLSGLPIEDRARIVRDILGIPETEK